MRGHVALAAGIAFACVSSASLAADIPTDVAVPVAPPIGDRFYVSFHGGYVFSSETRNHATNGVNSSDSVAYGAPGFRVGGALGREFGANFALEAEISYAQSELDRAFLTALNGVPVVPPAPLAPISGSGSTLTGMVNAFLGYDVGAIRPYVGAGVGVAYFTANNIVAGTATLDGSDLGFAAQAMAGIDFAIGQGTTLGARYRYVFLNDLSLPDGTFTHSFNIRTQSIDVVLKRAFN